MCLIYTKKNNYFGLEIRKWIGFIFPSHLETNSKLQHIQLRRNPKLFHISSSSTVQCSTFKNAIEKTDKCKLQHFSRAVTQYVKNSPSYLRSWVIDRRRWRDFQFSCNFANVEKDDNLLRILTNFEDYKTKFGADHFAQFFKLILPVFCFNYIASD